MSGKLQLTYILHVTCTLITCYIAIIMLFAGQLLLENYTRLLQLRFLCTY